MKTMMLLAFSAGAGMCAFVCLICAVDGIETAKGVTRAMGLSCIAGAVLSLLAYRLLCEIT